MCVCAHTLPQCVAGDMWYANGLSEVRREKRTLGKFFSELGRREIINFAMHHDQESVQPNPIIDVL